jgi:hypothetical protein
MLFSAGLHRSDLVEEIGRTRPRIVSELMKVANRFADGEDAYNNKRGRSLEVDRASRQIQRYRNADSHAKGNQVAAGYERRDEEGYQNRKFQARGNRGVEKPKYSGPSAEDMFYGPCGIHYAYLDGKRVSNHPSCSFLHSILVLGLLARRPPIVDMASRRPQHLFKIRLACSSISFGKVVVLST